MIARILCLLFGHKRGVRTADMAIDNRVVAGSATFRCPRCNETWTRKVYARKGKA